MSTALAPTTRPVAKPLTSYRPFWAKRFGPARSNRSMNAGFPATHQSQQRAGIGRWIPRIKDTAESQIPA